jgi:2-haloalkanoic acid dehalogenase type II
MAARRRSKRAFPRAILLDFYGTVVQEDDAPIARICEEIAGASASSATAEEIASYWAEVFGQLCSQSFGDIFQPQKELERISLQRVLQRFQAELDVGEVSRPLYEYWSAPEAFPESSSALAECGVPICLVSNTDNADLFSALRHTKLSFDEAVTSEDCRAYKPRGEVFAKALSVLGMSAEDVLHVGDSLRNDVHGAKRMGIRVLWINRKSRQSTTPGEVPDYASTDLTGLASVLKGQG